MQWVFLQRVQYLTHVYSYSCCHACFCLHVTGVACIDRLSCSLLYRMELGFKQQTLPSHCGHIIIGNSVQPCHHKISCKPCNNTVQSIKGVWPRQYFYKGVPRLNLMVQQAIFHKTLLVIIN